jgi:competence protein ComEA
MIIKTPPNLNLATAEELTTMIPNMDPSLAGELVKYRDQNGPFRSWTELQPVPGMTEQMLNRLRDTAVLEPEDAATPLRPA